ncbi:Rieske 2Fe-2S domain-containing protein [Halomonas sp. MCCC 1A17488]|uniref:Rieske (2Fe-2S) protein n=1 Tax=unclassified Halomonas TaxID=2609666 RepID=UPI0018D241FA|nr:MULTISPECIES: Rieske 2Fe-2S domain-containing protein [unclassified Halomonas]MCE8017504.1 Rieske 2Fe-2S domain-containing protein [Halomonas sp. MCCC 1A17488]MCG3240837.1 Rieske 2Fe-2S domain-containing protein [Halomonas sp. MCCC 1A17488]QPP49332.1 Rieske 2Fe-2S domain-containing protein [Halomonas sp. SS10-MC5]
MGHLGQLEAAPSRGVVLPDGRSAFLVRVHGRVSAFINRCPHQRVPLNRPEGSFLEAGGELIQCGMHGALFLPESGECVFGPCQGRFLEPVAISIDAEGNIHLAGE